MAKVAHSGDADMDAIERQARDLDRRMKEGEVRHFTVIGISREDNPADVDEAYGKGTYARLFPDIDDEEGAAA